MWKDPNEALRTLLQFCHPNPECSEAQAFNGALDAIEALQDCLSRAGRQMPNGQSVVAGLIAEGYCSSR